MSYVLRATGPTAGLADAIAAAHPALARRDDEDQTELSGDAVQATVFDGGAEILVPYWFEGDEAASALAEAHAIAAVLREAGLEVVDEQTGERVTDAVTDATLKAYAEGADAVRRVGEKPKRRFRRRS